MTGQWGISVPEISSISEAVPLTSSNTSIRLLEVLVKDDPRAQGTDDVTISCMLYTTDLSERPSYTALSYMWGDDTNLKTILVNGQRYGVRENLWDFLHRMREIKQAHANLADTNRNAGPALLTAHSLPLWIDAICIDQSLIPERNHQVSVMDEIFSSAQIVVSWLGRGNDNLYKGMRAADTYRHKRLELTPEWVNKALPYLSQVYTHPYWKRVWVMQEVILARRLEIWSGAASLDDHSSLQGAKIFSDTVGKDGSSELSYALFLLGHRLNRIYKEDIYYVLSSFGDALLLASDSACSDVRDRVYAILSLLDSEDRARLDVQPDYSKTTDELFLEVSFKIWNNLVLYDWETFRRYQTALGIALDRAPLYTLLNEEELREMYPGP